MIRARGVVKRFGTRVVLPGIDLTVDAGEAVSLVGPSGSGKSTFLRCLNGLEALDGGSVTIDGVELSAGLPASERDARLAAIRRLTGMVFQRFHLFPHLTALENAAAGPVWVLGRPKAEAEETARACLAEVGMLGKAAQRPDTLSGGESQRVAIARALAMKPKAMLLDEPTSALDPENAGEVAAVIIRLAELGQTMLVVTHNLDLARAVSDRVAFMEQGQIVEAGPPGEVLVSPRHERTRAFLDRERALERLRRHARPQAAETSSQSRNEAPGQPG